MSETLDSTPDATLQPLIAQRFRGFLPVVVDVETAGFNAKTDALLEIACIPIVYDANGQFVPGEAFQAHIQPFEGANLDRRSLDFIGIDPFNPIRMAMAEDERTALRRIFKGLQEVKRRSNAAKQSWSVIMRISI